jgi:hypothetical protein
VRYGFDDVGLDRIIAQTMTVNAGSRNVMERIGLTYVRTFPTSMTAHVDRARRTVATSPDATTSMSPCLGITPSPTEAASPSPNYRRRLDRLEHRSDLPRLARPNGAHERLQATRRAHRLRALHPTRARRRRPRRRCDRRRGGFASERWYHVILFVSVDSTGLSAAVAGLPGPVRRPVTPRYGT